MALSARYQNEIGPISAGTRESSACAILSGNAQTPLRQSDTKTKTSGVNPQTSQMEVASMDKQRIGAFAEAVYRDMAGAMAIGMGYIGQRTGLFKTLASAGAVSSSELAEKTGLHSRYVEEWLKGMTAAGWLEYDTHEETFSLPAEHAFLLASEGTDHLALSRKASAATLSNMSDN